MSDVIQTVNLSDNELLLSAITMTGPVPLDEDGVPNREAWYEELTVNINTLKFSQVALSRHFARIEKTMEYKPFYAVITGGKMEQNTGRLSIGLHIYDRDGNLDKEETIRTPHKDSAEGKRLIQLAKALKGRRVMVYKIVEKGKDGRSHRVLFDLKAAD